MPTEQAKTAEQLDVDVRFLLANERTLLAWIRTGLGLMAGGVALVQLAHERRWLVGIGLALVTLGAIATAAGHWRYRVAGKAIRAGHLPPPGHSPALITIGVTGLAAILILTFLIN